MDYDATGIPAVYDRGRDHGPALAELWMSEVAKRVERTSMERILDLGCGTGRFSNALAAHFRARLIGIDPSRKMLDQARVKPSTDRVSYACGTGEAIPLGNSTVDLVFMSMVFHHFRNSVEVARECRRVLRRGGGVFVRTGTVEQIHAYPYVPFIPASRPLLEERLPRKRLIEQVFELAGFKTTSVDNIVQQVASTYAAYAQKLEAGADSILASLDPTDLERGLEAIRAHGMKVDPQPVVEPIDLLFFE